MNKTMKKLLSITLAVIMLFGSVPMANLGIENLFTVDAEAANVGYIEYIYKNFLCEELNYNNKPCIYINKYLGSDEHITVPSEINGLPVVYIVPYAFSPLDEYDIHNPDCINIKSVILPDKLEVISKCAFKGCENLESIYLPDTIEWINRNAFEGCTSLESIKLPYSLTRLEEEVFKNCSALTNVDFGKEMYHLYSITESAFSGTAVKNLIIPENVGDEINYGLNIFEDALKGSMIEKLEINNGGVTFRKNSLVSDTLNELVVNSHHFRFYDDPFGLKSGNTHRPAKITFSTAEISQEDIENFTQYGYTFSRTDDGAAVFELSETDQPTFEKYNYTYLISDEKAMIISYNGKDEHVVIPETLDGYPVTELLSCAFSGNDRIISVTFPKTMERIGDEVFYDCDNLKTVNLNSGLKSMGTAVFCWTGIERIVIPEGITELREFALGQCRLLESVTAKGVTKIGKQALFCDFKLSSVEFSDDLNYIGYLAVSGCRNLKSIGVTGEKITYLGEEAFYGTPIENYTLSDKITAIPNGCFGDTAISEFTIPDTVTSIGRFAFSQCKLLAKIEIPDSVTEIGEEAFYDATALSGTLTIDKNIKKLGSKVFGNTGYTKLYFNAPECELKEDTFAYVDFEVIEIGNEITKIPDNCFVGQERVEYIIIPDSVTKICENSFKNCTSLKEVALPETITEIENGAFSGCSSLETFSVPKSVRKLHRTAIPETVKTVYFNAENCEFIGLEADRTEGYFSPFVNTSIADVVIGNTVKELPDYFFYGYDKVSEVVLPEGIKEIGKSAFKYSSVTVVDFSEGIISIENEAFYGTNVTIADNTFPNSLRIIGMKAFADCDSLTEVVISDSVVFVDKSAFMNCDNLKTVSLSSNVEYILDSTFSGCTSLNTFIWNSDIKLIGENAFANCVSLTEFDFKEVEKLYESSFIGSGVNFVQLGENKNEEATELEVVEVSSFENCANLETLSIGGNVATIKSAAFANCEKLETAVISPTVTNIASDAFDGCDALTIYCVEESYAHEYALNNGIPVSTFVIDAIPNQVYTGKEIEPDVNVKVSNKNLTENTDFAVNYSNNINVGTAKVLVSGKGIYKVLASVANFTIITKNVENITVSPVVNQIYDGSELKPEITVTNGDKILTEGVDYTVTYKNNTEAGTATAEITGIGNYSGKTTVTFEILEQTFWQKAASFFEMIINAIVNFFRSIFK